MTNKHLLCCSRLKYWTGKFFLTFWVIFSHTSQELSSKYTVHKLFNCLLYIYAYICEYISHSKAGLFVDSFFCGKFEINLILVPISYSQQLLKTYRYDLGKQFLISQWILTTWLFFSFFFNLIVSNYFCYYFRATWTSSTF